MTPIQRSASVPPISVTVSPSVSGRDLTIVVVGEADWTTAVGLRDQLVAAFGPTLERVALELDGLAFCNLRGLGALHEAVEVARRAGVDVTLRGMSRQLSWLHSSFPERLSPTGGADLPPAGPRRGCLVVDALGHEPACQSAGTA